MTAAVLVAYHYSPSGTRESISEIGLLVRRPGEQTSLAERDGHRAGVYMFKDLAQALMLEDGDVYAIDLAGIDVEDDPFHAPGLALVAYTPIPAHRVRWIQSV